MANEVHKQTAREEKGKQLTPICDNPGLEWAWLKVTGAPPLGIWAFSHGKQETREAGVN